MADRLTQLQEAVNQLGEYFCNSIGVLQANSEPPSQQNESKENSEDNSALFSGLIARTAQDIDILIDSLPSQEYTQNVQETSLRKLQVENQQVAEKLRAAVEEGELLLKMIRGAITEISNSQLGISDPSSKQS